MTNNKSQSRATYPRGAVPWLEPGHWRKVETPSAAAGSSGRVFRSPMGRLSPPQDVCSQGRNYAHWSPRNKRILENPRAVLLFSALLLGGRAQQAPRSQETPGPGGPCRRGPAAPSLHLQLMFSMVLLLCALLCTFSTGTPQVTKTLKRKRQRTKPRAGAQPKSLAQGGGQVPGAGPPCPGPCFT